MSGDETVDYAFLTYGDDGERARLSPAQHGLWVDEMQAHDADILAAGQILLAVSLKSPSETATVRVRNGVLTANDGPCASARLTGIFIVSAIDMNDAIRMAGQLPAARSGDVEIRPVKYAEGE